MIDPKPTTTNPKQTTMNEGTKTPEPLAAILAEMRDERIIRLDGADVTRCLLRNLADRIEAAAKRERSEIRRDAEIEWTRIGYEERKAEEKRAPGNATAMREALMKAKLYFDHRGEGTNFDDAGMAIDAITSIDAALATPARNCDRFEDGPDALDAYRGTLRDGEEVRVPWLLDWLFEPAEGGVHA